MMTSRPTSFEANQELQHWTSGQNNRLAAYVKMPFVCFDGLSHRLHPQLSQSARNRPLGQGQGQFRYPSYL